MTRTLVVWCPDWPLVAAGIPTEVPAAVFHANRVVACNAAARDDGVRRGQRRREAQGCCPDLVVEAHDPSRDARAFEAVMSAVASFTPRVEVTRPGACALATRGPSRYFGGDEPLATRVSVGVDAVLPPGAPACKVGVADGPFAAALAARRSMLVPTVVPPGQSAAFLAPLAVELVDEPDIARLLVRLGLHTLGAFAALGEADVAARFGPLGQRAHRRARGLDDRSLDVSAPPVDRSAIVELDPPADRVDVAAFAAKRMADELCAALSEEGLVCTCIRIESETEHGEHLSRVWRHHRAFTAAAIAERVRWQLDGWLVQQLSGGLTMVRLVLEEVTTDDGRQQGFWGGATAADERASRGLARLQVLLGPEAVVTAVLSGGRDPVSQIRLVPWGDPREPAAKATKRSSKHAEAPVWPGRVPRPSPALVHRHPVAAELIDPDRYPVGVSGRGLLTASVARLSVAGGPWVEVTDWAGPWPADERWWDPVAYRRRARLQILTDTGMAHLLALEGGRWWVEATYD